VVAEDVSAGGRILYGWSHLGKQDPAQKAIMVQIQEAVREKFKRFSDLFATNVDAAPKDGSWQVRAEVVGARIISPEESAAIEKEVSRELGVEIKIFFWSKSQAMVTPQGYDSVEDFTKKRLEKMEGVRGEPSSPQGEAPATEAAPGGK
jgi:hypothetical protein